MTNTLSAFPLALALRGDRTQRPLRDDRRAQQLHDQLHQLLARSPYQPSAPLILRSSSLRAQTPSFESSELGRLRGLLVTTALRLLVNGVHLDDSFADVHEAWLSTQAAGPLRQSFELLNDDQRARLAADIRSHVSVLREHLGAIPSSWRPRTVVRTRLLLGGGALELRDEVDLVVGSPFEDVAALALLDVTTAPLGENAERVLRYHALVQTLRSGVVPLRSCLFSTATTDLWSRDVDDELLQRALADVASVLQGSEAA